MRQPRLPARDQRLTLLDLLGIVALSGFGFSAWRIQAAAKGHLAQNNPLIAQIMWYVVPLVSWQIFALAWFVLIRAVRLPRPDRAQRGYIAALAVVVAWGFGDIQNLLPVLTMNEHKWSIWRRILHDLTNLPPESNVGAAVVTAWILISWCDLGDRPPGPAEKLGRLVGYWFIGLFFFHVCAAWYQRIREVGKLNNLLFPAGISI